jgi:hypothetical protein
MLLWLYDNSMSIVFLKTYCRNESSMQSSIKVDNCCSTKQINNWSCVIYFIPTTKHLQRRSVGCLDDCVSAGLTPIGRSGITSIETSAASKHGSNRSSCSTPCTEILVKGRCTKKTCNSYLSHPQHSKN